jgi:hypothetical protein
MQTMLTALAQIPAFVSALAIFLLKARRPEKYGDKPKAEQQVSGHLTVSWALGRLKIDSICGPGESSRHGSQCCDTVAMMGCGYAPFRLIL